MSLLTACQAAVNVTGLGAAPATIIGNTNPLAIQLNYLAERAAKSLRMKPWQAMIREHTITTSAGTENYALPADLAFYVSQTAWDATNYWPMRGSLAPAVWQSLKRGNIAGTQIFKDFRVRELSHDRRHGVNLCHLRRAPTPLTRDDLIFCRPR